MDANRRQARAQTDSLLKIASACPADRSTIPWFWFVSHVSHAYVYRGHVRPMHVVLAPDRQQRSNSSIDRIHEQSCRSTSVLRTYVTLDIVSQRCNTTAPLRRGGTVPGARSKWGAGAHACFPFPSLVRENNLLPTTPPATGAISLSSSIGSLLPPPRASPAMHAAAPTRTACCALSASRGRNVGQL